MRPLLPIPNGRIFCSKIAWLLVLPVCLHSLNVFAFNIGDRVQANGLVWVRQTAGGTHIGNQASATLGTIVGGPAYAKVDGIGNTLTWYNIRWPSAPNGWVGTAGLKAAAVSAPAPVVAPPTYTPVTAMPQPMFPPVVASPVYTPATIPAIGNVSPPVITAVSPASLPPLKGNQPLTISGNNFQNGATLTFVPPEGGAINSSASKLSVVSGNQINYQINNLSDSGNWTVRVNNPNGQSSRPVSFTVPAIAQPMSPPVVASPIYRPATAVVPSISSALQPSITGIFPASLPPLNGNQPLTISGNNFQNGATLTFVPPERGAINSAASKLSFVSANQINYQINNLSSSGNWTVRVNNPNGQSSRPVSFTVAAIAQPMSPPVVASPIFTPATVSAIGNVSPPVITGVSPASLPPLKGNQPLTISGNNFQNGATLTFVPPEGGAINSAASKLSFVSSRQINYQINNLSDSGNWTVRVNNPDGQFSRPVNFTVATVTKPAPSPATLSPILDTTQPDYTPTTAVLPSLNLQYPPVLTLPNSAADMRMAGSTPTTNSFVLPPWLKVPNIPQALSSILADVSKTQNLPLKLETHTDTKFGGLVVGEYRITADASINLKGVAGTLKMLQKVDDVATLYSIYDNAKSEFESRGITGHSLINAWVSSPQSIVFAFQNPDAGIQALVDGLTSASAVSIRFASFGLIEVHGPEVEQWVNKIANVNSGLQTLPSSKASSSQPNIGHSSPPFSNPQFPAGPNINPRSYTPGQNSMMPGVLKPSGQNSMMPGVLESPAPKQ